MCPPLADNFYSLDCHASLRLLAMTVFLEHTKFPSKESPTKFINFAGADGGELLLLELAFQILKIDQLFAHKRNLV